MWFLKKRARICNNILVCNYAADKSCSHASPHLKMPTCKKKYCDGTLSYCETTDLPYDEIHRFLTEEELVKRIKDYGFNKFQTTRISGIVFTYNLFRARRHKVCQARKRLFHLIFIDGSVSCDLWSICTRCGAIKQEGQ